MKPIYQTRDGWPNGNCWAASAATITGIPLEKIDAAIGPALGWGDRYEEVRAFFAAEGWWMIYIPFDHWSRFPAAMGFDFPYILAGTNGGGLGHAVVAQGGEVIHNPNRRPGSDLLSVDGAYLFLRAVPVDLPVSEGPSEDDMDAGRAA